jgi:hypothetical protein
MKRLSIMLLMVIPVFVLACSQRMSGRSEPGWTTLLDGADPKTLDNWSRSGGANWRVEDGAIVADKGKSGYLISKNSYKDFQIRAEFWADHTTNSGIFLRIADPNKISPTTGYEVNIFDQREDPSYGTGAIVNFATVSPMPKAGGKWNTFEITAKGSELVVVLNGIQTVKINHNQFAQGPIALQYGSGPKGAPGGAIKWRKLQIRTL